LRLPNHVLPHGLCTATTVAAPSMSAWATDNEMRTVVGADAIPSIVLSSTACPDGAEMDCPIRRSTKAMPVTITPTLNASFVATQ
jgi:hypothetical protein